MNAFPFLKAVVAAALLAVVARAAGDRPTVYVADFFTRDREITPTTMKLTSEFEIALGGTGQYEILERRDFDKLRAEAKNEAAIADIGGLPGTLVNALKTKHAEMVVFGEVFDDVDSGQVSVSVSFVAFSGEKKRLLNIKIPRGKINDSDTRTAAMEELVRKIATSSRKIAEVEARGFRFQVVRARASGRVVVVELTITNNEDDKQLRLSCNQTVFFDEKGNRAKSTSLRLANLVGRTSVSLDTISGVPVKASVEFSGVAPTATTIARLDLSGWDSVQRDAFVVSLRNIPIER